LNNPLEAVDQLIKDTNKKFGKDTLGYSPSTLDLDFISTGSLALDIAIGGGQMLMGIPHGRMTEIWGPKATGKSTLGNHIIANAQAQGKTTALFDYEQTYDPVYATAIGVDPNKLLLGQYDQLEQGWQIMEAFMRTIKDCLIVVDSLPMMTPRAEHEGEMGDHHPGLQPRLLGQAMRRNTGWVRKNNIALVVINQVRHKLNVRNPKYERSETQPGGEAFKHAVDLQINLGLGKTNREGDDPVSSIIRAYIQFNKIAKPYGKAEYNILFGKGIDKVADLMEVAPACGAIDQRGHYYYVGEEKIANGKDAFFTWLENPENFEKIYQEAVKIMSKAEVKDEEDKTSKTSKEKD